MRQYVNLSQPLMAGEVLLWLDAMIRQYGPDVPLWVDVHGMPVQLGDAKLKRDGKGTCIVVFLPVEGETP